MSHDGVAVLGSLVVLSTLHRHPPLPCTLTQRRVVASAVRTLGVLWWPPLLLRLLPPEDRGKSCVMVPLLWTYATWLLDLHLLHRAPSVDPDTVPATLRFEPTMVTALAFGLSSLTGTRPDGKYTHLFLYAILGCVVVVLPSHNLAPGCVEALLFESVQKVALQWCVGLMVAGVTLTRHCPSP